MFGSFRERRMSRVRMGRKFYSHQTHCHRQKTQTPAHKKLLRGYSAFFSAVIHSKVSFTSSAVLIAPSAIFGAGGSMPKSVIFSLVVPLTFILLFSTLDITTSKSFVLVTPAHLIMPLVLNFMPLSAFPSGFIS